MESLVTEVAASAAKISLTITDDRKSDGLSVSSIAVALPAREEAIGNTEP
jgi:hypothetical protein